MRLSEKQADQMIYLKLTGDPMKKRIALLTAYDGTDYCGWQIQPNGVTIEEKLNTALTELLGEPIHVTGASRTDAGVHSLGNVAIFDTQTRIPPEKIAFALNQRLPDDIVIRGSWETAPDWHPRKCNSRKTYEYRILNAIFPDPTCRRNTYFYYRQLDFCAMAQAAKLLEGTHDFKSFCSANTPVENTVRTIYECSLNVRPAEGIYGAAACGGAIPPAAVMSEEMVCSAGEEEPGRNNGQAEGGDAAERTSPDCRQPGAAMTPDMIPQLLTIRVCGSGFLYNMVRIIAGTLISVGIGELAPAQIGEILEAKDRKQAGPTAPACGLTMIGIEFE